MKKHDNLLNGSKTITRDLLTSVYYIFIKQTSVFKINESIENEFIISHKNCEDTIKKRDDEFSKLNKEIEN